MARRFCFHYRSLIASSKLILGSIKFQDVVVVRLVYLNSVFVGCVIFVVDFCHGKMPFPTPFLWQCPKKSKEKSLQKKEKISAPSHESSPIANLDETISGYLTGWFAPDVALLSLDVITFSSTSSSAQSLTLLRLFRSLRLLRLVRMVGRAHLLKEHLTGLEFMGALASATWEQFSRFVFFGFFEGF